jgi:hypothetical protein
MTPEQQALVDALEVKIDEVSEGSDRPAFSAVALYDHLVDGTRDVLRDVQGSLAFDVASDGRPKSSDPIGRDATGSGAVIPLPAGFVRALRIGLKSWRRALDTFSAMGGPEHRAQQNRRAGATEGRPLAVLVPAPQNAALALAPTSIEAFPAPAQNVTVTELTVIVGRAPEAMPPSLRDAVLWAAAARALTAARQGDAASHAARYASAALSSPSHGVTA